VRQQQRQFSQRHQQEETEGRFSARSTWRRRGTGTEALSRQIIAKNQTRFTGFDDKIISMYSRGMTTREIEGHLKEMYGVDVSPALVSSVTEAVMEEVKAWQNRTLEETYAILYLDALRVKIRDAGHVQNRAILRGDRGSTWRATRRSRVCVVADNEGAKFLAADPDRSTEPLGPESFSSPAWTG